MSLLASLLAHLAGFVSWTVVVLAGTSAAEKRDVPKLVRFFGVTFGLVSGFSVIVFVLERILGFPEIDIDVFDYSKLIAANSPAQVSTPVDVPKAGHPPQNSGDAVATLNSLGSTSPQAESHPTLDGPAIQTVPPSPQTAPSPANANAAYCSGPDSDDLFQAHTLNDSKEYDASIDLYGRIIDRCPESAEAYEGRGIARGVRTFSTHDPTEFQFAISDLTHAIKLDPKQASYFVNRGSVYTNMQNYSAAITDFSRALSINFGDATTLSLRGNALNLSGDTEGALVDFGRAIATNPMNFQALEWRGDLYLHQNRCTEAIRDFSLAINVAPDPGANPALPELINNRGVCYRTLGQNHEARADFERALRLEPSSDDIRQNLASVE